MEEIWKDIEGYEGQYQVSNLGRVKTLARLTVRPAPATKTGWREYRIPEKIMRLRPGTRGYLCVNLRQEEKPVTLMVHRLVAKAFVPNPDNLPIINHKDENRQNNRADNLEWCTAQYNVTYGHALELRYEKLKKCPVAMFKPDGTLIRTFPTAKDAERFIGKRGASRNIIMCCNGSRHHRTNYGYKWSYVIDGKIQPPTPDPTPEEKAASNRLRSEHHGRKRAVEQISLEGVLIAEYDSIIKASGAVGVAESVIRRAAAGKYKTAGGYRWRYKENK